MTNQLQTVRVRFAPSPTGNLHIGSLRTALFNWLYARRNGGTYLVRIEDTDRIRSKQNFTDSILASLQWACLESDEPPIIQSSRAREHEWAIKKLLETGQAYKCFCSPDELEDRCKDSKGIIRYDRNCLNRISGNDERAHVVRFRLPDDLQQIAFHDLVRGEITISADQLDDFIIVRSDRTPVYNLVVVVDDNAMEISHVIRGEDHISNTPKQILLYEALSLPIPQFGHLPLILNQDGSRLSKRDAATDVLDYHKRGYLSPALINYLVRLGWSHGDQEIFSLDNLILVFDISDVGKSGATFDIDKLNWLNSVWLQNGDAGEILELISSIRSRFELELANWSKEELLDAVRLYASRSVTLLNCADQIKSLHDGPAYFKKEDIVQLHAEEAVSILNDLITVLDGIDQWNSNNLQFSLLEIKKNHNLKTPQINKPLRLALTGFSSGPSVISLLEIVGKSNSIKRIHTARDYIKREMY